MSFLHRMSRLIPKQAGLVVVACVVALVACDPRGDAKPAASHGQADSAALTPSDPRVGTAEQAGCLLGDTLLRQVFGIETQRKPSVPFDSLWHGSSERWACRVLAAGRTRSELFSVDSVRRGFTARGWSDRTMISADGPDGTVQGVHRGGVTCLLEGRWDGGDDSDSTYVPSDTIEVRVACTRTIRADTILPETAR